MMGRHRFAAKLYYQLSLDALIPDDHLLLLIGNAVDFSFVHALAEPSYSHTGQPSVDPVVLFKTLLVAYLYGVTSERRLMQGIRWPTSGYSSMRRTCGSSRRAGAW